MAYIKPIDFIKLTAVKKIPPVVLLAGDESYFLDLCLENLEKSMSAGDFNKDVFYGFENSAEVILDAVQTLTFSGEKRIVIVKDVNKMRSPDTERIGEYVLNPLDTTCLVLVYFGIFREIKKDIVARKNMIAKCENSKNAVCVNCSKVYEKDAKEFIKNEVKKEGKNISYDATLRVLDENGCDLLNLSNEIEKLVLFVGNDKKTIDQDDIEYVSGQTKEINQYTLIEHIEAKDRKKAIFVLEKLLSEGTDASFLLSSISSSIRRLLNAKSLYEQKGDNPDQVLPYNLPPFKKQVFKDNLKKFDLASLKSYMKEILNADISIKTGSCDTFSTLEKLILVVCK
ncbi:MAG: DNA polymerase III subunit delta [Elusimicrobiota bacterium]|jgi:DNA polymerase-3 subunit delta|nr:DNA polymerase III subunit delta [Elusimicrobiota bacterium]